MKKMISLLCVAAMLLSMAAGCGSDKEETKAGETQSQTKEKGSESKTKEPKEAKAFGETGEEILIGVTGPMTGAAALNGQYMTNATQMAADEWNEKGGILIDGVYRPVRLVFEDDQATASTALNAVTKQIHDNGVFALIGPHHSGCVLSVADMCVSENVVLLTGGTSTKISDLGNPNVFRIRASDALTASLAFKYCKDSLGTDKIGMMYINNDFGTGALSVVEEAAKEANVELLAVEGFNTGDTDMSGQLLKMQQAGCEAVVCWSDDAEGAIIARQYHEYGLTDAFALVGSATFSLSNFYSTTDESNADGIYSVNDYAYTNGDPQVVEFEKKYYETFGIHSDLYSAAYYDAANLLFTAMEKAGKADTDAVREALKTIEYDGVMANDKFDDVNDGIHQILIIRNEGCTPAVETTVYE